jgi:hypothetical protein
MVSMRQAEGVPPLKDVPFLPQINRVVPVVR